MQSLKKMSFLIVISSFLLFCSLLLACKPSAPSKSFSDKVNSIPAQPLTDLGTNDRALRTLVYWNTAARHFTLLRAYANRTSGNIRLVGRTLQDLPADGVDEEAVRTVTSAAGTLVETANFLDFGIHQQGLKAAAVGAAAANAGDAARGAAVANGLTSGLEAGFDLRANLGKADAQAAVTRAVLGARYSRKFERLEVAYFQY